jgi:transcriptional regulator with XRE-family HTH domain
VQQTDLIALGHEIERLLGDRSQAWLAEQVGVDQSTISRLIRGQHRASADKLARAARALGTDPAHLMRLAGVPLPNPNRERDSRVEHAAQRLDELLPQLSPPLREMTLEMLADLIDLVGAFAQEQKSCQ